MVWARGKPPSLQLALALVSMASAVSAKGPVVIGLGWGRTGTQTLRRALEILGHKVFGDSEKVWNASFSIPLYEAVAGREWHLLEMIEEAGYTASVGLDQHAAILWKAYGVSPNVKAILTVRDYEDWYVSLWGHMFWESRFFVYLNGAESWKQYCPGQHQSLLWNALLQQLTRPNECNWCGYWHRLAQKTACLNQLWYKNEARKKLVPNKDQLLEYDVRDGWGPLCKFLGVPVPSEPFPRQDSSSPKSANFRVWKKNVYWKTLALAALTYLAALIIFLASCKWLCYSVCTRKQQAAPVLKLD